MASIAYRALPPLPAWASITPTRHRGTGLLNMGQKRGGLAPSIIALIGMSGISLGNTHVSKYSSLRMCEVPSRLRKTKSSRNYRSPNPEKSIGCGRRSISSGVCGSPVHQIGTRLQNNLNISRDTCGNNDCVGWNII